MQSKYYMVSEVGRRCGPPVTGARIRQLIDQDKISATRTERGLRLVSADELSRFLAQRRRQQAAAAQ